MTRVHCYSRDQYNIVTQVECLVHPNLEFIWVNIPKNSSTMINGYLKKQEWNNTNLGNSLNQDKIFLIVLRDPLDRWASGMAEYMYRYHPNFDFDQVTDLLKEIIIKQKFFDEHAFPQCAFIDQLPIEQCVYFKMDDYLVPNLQDYLQRHCNVVDNSLQYVGRSNTAKDFVMKQKLKDFFLDMISLPKYRESIEDFYKYDIFLYNSVTYYQRPTGV